MCGICGFVEGGVAPPDPALIKRMLGRLAHRGPDGSGWFRDDRCALGHTRLAIVDLVGGVQPLCNEDGSVWISFNGEIFNYIELHAELEALGHRFKTKSDTEVIVHAWEQWGEGAFSRFNGQWAIAIWERAGFAGAASSARGSSVGRLILSRDRMGIRPLFTCASSGRFRFASEAKALFADPSVPRELDPAGLDETLSLWSTVAPRGIFKGVEELPPGHWAVYEHGRLTVKPYWSADFPAAGTEAVQDIVENGRLLRDALVKAVRLRFLRADVPVGAYLSGGIDSSLSAAIIRKYTDAPLRTFSLRFKDAEFDEGRYQDEMAERLGTEHMSVMVSADDIAEVFPEVCRYAEKPILRAAPAPLFLLSRLVRSSGYKVVVTGEGADEVLGGYDIFREAKVRLFWARDPSSALRARAVELLYPWMERAPGKAPAFAKAFFGQAMDANDPGISHRPRWNATRAVQGLLSSGMRSAVQAATADPEAAVLARMPAGAASWDSLTRAQWLEMTTLLPGYILSSQGDRMLMGNSVEGRFPFLDPELIALANGLPARHKLMGLDEKHILKREFADLLPQSILRRPKQPYRAPDAASFFSEAGRAWMDDIAGEAALRRAGIFEPASIAGLLAKCERVGGEKMSNTDNQRVLAVLSTMLIHKHFIEGDGSGSGAEAPPEPMAVHDFVKGN